MRGRVVVYSNAATLCRTHDVYEEMVYAGAAGIVVVEPWNPLEFLHTGMMIGATLGMHLKYAE